MANLTKRPFQDNVLNIAFKKCYCHPVAATPAGRPAIDRGSGAGRGRAYLLGTPSGGHPEQRIWTVESLAGGSHADTQNPTDGGQGVPECGNSRSNGHHPGYRRK